MAASFRRLARIPEVYPPLVVVTSRDDGTMWLQLRQSDVGQPVLAIDEVGDVIGTVVLRSGSRIAVAARERLWVVETDEYGVDSVVRYQVVWHRR